LYRVARENRRVLRQLMGAADASDPGLAQLASRASQHFVEALSRIERVVALSGQANRYPLDPPISLATTAGMIISSAIYDDWLFPASAKPVDETRVIREISEMMLHGVSHRQPRSRKPKTVRS
jgi:hypothetical protein